MLENLLFDINGSDYAKDVKVLDTGEVFILGLSRYDSMYHPFLLKLHQDYSVDWQTFFVSSSYRPSYGLEISEEGSSYVQIEDIIYYVSPEGHISRTDLEFNAENFRLTSDGYIWCSGVRGEYTQPMDFFRRDLSVSKILYPSLDTMVTSIFRYKYSPVFFDSSWHSNIAIDEDEESIYVLSQKGMSFVQSIIVKVTQDCSISWRVSIQDGGGGGYSEDWNFWYDIEVLEEDLICVAGNDFPSFDLKLTFAIFDFSNLIAGETIDWILIGAIAGAVVIADVAIIAYMKRRKQPVEDEGEDLREVFDDILENS